MIFTATSLRVRLTLLFAALTSALIALLGLSLGYALSMQLAARELEELAGKLQLFRHVISEVDSQAALDASRHRLQDILVGHDELRAAVFDLSGGPLVRLSEFPWPPALISQAEGDGLAEGSIEAGEEPFSVLVATVARRGGEPLLVALARSSADSRDILRRFRTAIILACLLGSAGAGALGYFAVDRSLRPVKRIAGAAAQIGADRLGDRLDVKDAPLELRDMAESFNGMLERLERSFNRLSQFSADLAHELRTPLTSLTLQAQIALDRPRSAEELRTVLASGLEELERLRRMVSDMLFLAKADHAQVLLERQVFGLEEEVAKVFEYFEPLAEERGVRLALEGAARAHADRGMVRRVLANLLSNAVRHARDGSTVTVRVSRDGGAAAVDVENQGVALSGEEAQRVFDRFYRAEPSRGPAGEGAGLGLAIVRSIADLHWGAASARGTARGTAFRVTFADGPVQAGKM